MNKSIKENSRDRFQLETELARAILSGEIQDGQEVTANVSDGKIFFENENKIFINPRNTDYLLCLSTSERNFRK